MKAPVINARVIVESALFQATAKARDTAEVERDRMRDALLDIRAGHDGCDSSCRTRKRIDAALQPSQPTQESEA